MGERVRQMFAAEPFEPAPVEQVRPEDSVRHPTDLAPVHAGSQSGADEAPDARPRDDRGTNARIVERLDDSDVSETADSAAAQGEADPRAAKLVQSAVHTGGLYVGEPRRIEELDEALRRLKIIESITSHTQVTKRNFNRYGRNAWTRFIDKLLAAIRRKTRPVHTAGATLSAILLFLYARLTARTIRLLTQGGRRCWPYLPVPCVITLWHGCAPSLLAAIVKERPARSLAIMVARDPRGDCLALVCRLLGLRVVRGESGEGGWAALSELAREIMSGSCVIVTADGGGPAREAKMGAVALASATGAPLLPLGADCRPAINERRKWDRARNPIPFGQVAIALSEPLRFPAFTDAASLERARKLTQGALDDALQAASVAVGSVIAGESGEGRYAVARREHGCGDGRAGRMRDAQQRALCHRSRARSGRHIDAHGVASEQEAFDASPAEDRPRLRGR